MKLVVYAYILWASSGTCLAQKPSLNDLLGNESGIIRIPSTEWGLTMQIKSLEGDGLGLDYTWVPFPNARDGGGMLDKYGVLGDVDWGLNADIKAEGFLGFGSGDDETSPKALRIEGNLFANVIASEIAGQDWWIDFGCSAFQFEADQDFDTINYVFRPYILTPIPGSHLLSAAVQRMLNQGASVSTEEGGVDLRNDRPVYLRAGYALVKGIKESDSDVENRIELGATWRVSLYRGTSLEAGYRHFIEPGRDYGFLEVALSIPIKRDLSILVKYIDGELPPTLGVAEAVSAGVSISF